MQAFGIALMNLGTALMWLGGTMLVVVLGIYFFLEMIDKG